MIVSDIDQASCDATAAAIGRGAVGIRANVTNALEVAALFDKVVEKFGQVDIVVNNAGVTRDNLIMRISDDDWDMVLNVNLKGAFNCSKAVARQMMKQRYGRIVNISSVAGLAGNAGQTNYASSKAGVIGFTRALARELALQAEAQTQVATQFQSHLPEAAADALLVGQAPVHHGALGALDQQGGGIGAHVEAAQAAGDRQAGGVEDAIAAKGFQEALGDLEGATVFGDVFAVEHNAAVAHHLLRKRLLDGVLVGELAILVLVELGQRIQAIVQTLMRENVAEFLASHGLAIDGRGRVYVTQMGKKGISVFGLTYPG